MVVGYIYSESGDDMTYSIFKRMLTYILVILLSGFLILIIGIQISLNNTQKNVQIAYSNTQSAIIENIFAKEKDIMESLIQDYAVWDDLYAAIENGNYEWSKENATEFMVETPDGFSLDFVYVFGNNNGYQEVYGETSILSSIGGLDAYKLSMENHSVETDFVMVEDTLYLMAMSPVTTNNKRMTNGYYVMAREYSPGYVESMVEHASNRDEFLGSALDDEAVNQRYYTSLTYDLKNKSQQYLTSFTFNYDISTYTRPYSNLRNYSIVVIVLTVTLLIVTFMNNIKMLLSGRDDLMSRITALEEGRFEAVSSRSQVREIQEVLDAINHLGLSLGQREGAVLDHHMDTLTVIIDAIEEKDRYVKGHSSRVKEIAMIIGEIMNVEDMKTLEEAALLHDIGKISISPEILNKPGKLTVEEYNVVKTHTNRGQWIVNGIPYLKRVGEIIVQHHERYDGRGYPRRLIGEEIDLLARIISVSDALEAMCSDRAHREKIDFYQAVSIIKKERDKQFDGKVVNAFLEGLEEIRYITRYEIHEEENSTR